MGASGRPIKGATLIGNGPDVLTRVRMVGNDLKLDEGIGVCGKEGQSVPVGVGQPTLRVDGLTVGGHLRVRWACDSPNRSMRACRGCTSAAARCPGGPAIGCAPGRSATADLAGWAGRHHRGRRGMAAATGLASRAAPSTAREEPPAL